MRKTLVIFSFVSFLLHGQRALDSALSLAGKAGKDTGAVSLYLFLAENHPDANVWRAYNQKALEVCEGLMKNADFKIRSRAEILYSKALNNSGYSDLEENRIFSAMGKFKNAQQLLIRNNSADGMAGIYSNMGAAMEKIGRLDRATEFYQQALKEEEKRKDPAVLGAILNNLATIYSVLKSPEKAKLYYERAISLYLELNDEDALLQTYNNLTVYFLNLQEKEEALSLGKKSLDLARKLGDSLLITEAMVNLSQACALFPSADTLMSFLNTCVAQAKKHSSQPLLALAAYNLSEFHIRKNDLKPAEPLLLLSYRISDSVGDIYETRNMALKLSDLYSSMKDFEKSNYFLNRHRGLSELIFSEENSAASIKMDLQMDFDRRESELKRIQEKNEEEIRRQKLMRNSLLAGSALLLGLVVMIVINLRGSKKAQRQLAVKNASIERQKRLVEEKQQEIISSINYAHRIQSAILTGDEVWKRITKDFFIFYRPKDIVSGDFYWAHLMTNGRAVFAVADCTGHGVPGGFMSMLGNSFLNEIVVENKIFSAAAILNRLREKVIRALEQKGETGQQDGMDMALCVWNKMDNSLDFAGANNSVFIIREGKIIDLKGNKMPIGTHVRANDPFVSQTFSMQRGDSLYLTTDGLPDQFGGPKVKKYRYSQLQTVVLAMQELDMATQGEILKKDFEEWKGNLEQTDDVCVIGIRV